MHKLKNLFKTILFYLTKTMAYPREEEKPFFKPKDDECLENEGDHVN